MRALAFLLGAVLACAHAAPDPRASYNEARSAYEAGHFQEAADGFAALYAQSGIAAVLFNQGQALRGLGDLAGARKAFEAYLASKPANPAPALLQLRILAAARAAMERPDPAALLAVLEFRTARPAPAPPAVTQESSYLTDVARSAVADAGYAVMTRDNAVILLRQQGHTPADCIDLCEVDTGRLIGADYLVTGELSGTPGALRLSVRLHDTSTARYLGGVQASGAAFDQLEAALRRDLPPLLLRIPPRARK